MDDISTIGSARPGMVSRFWRTARGFWSGRSARVAWFLSAGLLVIIVIQVVVQYGMNLWNRAIFDALEQKNASTVLFQSAIFFPIAGASIACAVAVVWARMRLQRRWRAWMTETMIDRWVDKGRYYQLNLIEGDHKNPEYRLAEDMRVSTESPVDMAVGLTSAFLTASTFIVVLWSLGGSIEFSLGGSQYSIPGYLVIAVLVYCGIISGCMTVIARAFIPAAEAKNQSEAEFRYALTRVRENGESIAILNGEEEERSGLNGTLRKVIYAWASMAKQYMRTTAVSHGNFIFASVLPIILCSPKYLNGTMTLGQVMQAAAAFIQVQYAFNWIVDNYPRLAEWTASARRVSNLMFAIDDLDAIDGKTIKRLEREGSAIQLKDVSVMLSDGTVVVDEADVKVGYGEKVLLAGESGTGKSTLVRAIAGLWPWGEGEIAIRPGSKLFLMPQKPYIPLGTLRRAATYPISPDSVDDPELKDALERVGLGHTIERLDEKDTQWDRILSGGEQQRLAFVRLLLQKPDVVVMDEATSALDTDSQAKLLTAIGEELPKTAIISVGHRKELEDFHERKLNLVRREGGARLTPAEMGAPAVSGPAPLLRRLRTPWWRRRAADNDREKIKLNTPADAA